MAKVSSAAQTGVLMPGPGGERLNLLLADLIPLTSSQLEAVNLAKKYAMEQSMKSILQRQAVVNNQQQQQKSLQRHQALVLMCRVYVGSISFEVREETIRGVFGPFGAIKSINMSWDPVSLNHKGFAFVEYEIPEAAQLALEHMNGVQVGGRQIKVGRPSNMPQAAPIIQQIQEECKNNNRIYISNIHPNLSELELIELFDPFGRVRSCKLAMTPNVDVPQHRGYGFIEFDSEGAANEALTMNNFDLGGQALHVCRATTPAENLSIYGALDSECAQASTIVQNTSSEDDIQLQLERTDKEQQLRAESEIAASFDIDRAQENGQEPSSSPRAHEVSNTSETEVNIPRDASTSNIIVLRNMVTADEEVDDSLQLDVYEECAKYGAVTQIVIFVGKEELESQSGDSRTDEIRIFVKYKDNQGSFKAREALNGRFFAGRQVSAEFYDREAFRLSDYSR